MSKIFSLDSSVVKYRQNKTNRNELLQLNIISLYKLSHIDIYFNLLILKLFTFRYQLKGLM